MHSKLSETKTELEKLKLDAGNIGEADVKASSVFKALQSHFSVVFADNSQQKAQLEETKRVLVASKQQHIAQVSPSVSCVLYWSVLVILKIIQFSQYHELKSLLIH